jgi:LacI family transcriptional regulator
VPDDFSVLSVIASQYAEMLTPALTSVEWPAFEAGRLAAEMLIERLRDSAAAPRQLLIGGDLTVRDSTGPAPARGAKARRSPKTRRVQRLEPGSGDARQSAVA